VSMGKWQITPSLPYLGHLLSGGGGVGGCGSAQLATDHHTCHTLSCAKGAPNYFFSPRDAHAEAGRAGVRELLSLQSHLTPNWEHNQRENGSSEWMEKKKKKTKRKK
jgi:hypothetical protein